MYVAAGFIVLDTSECISLKENRSIVRSLIGKASAKFTLAALAQVGNANDIKSASIGAAVISNDHLIAQTMLSKVLQYLEQNCFRKILDSKAEIHALV